MGLPREWASRDLTFHVKLVDQPSGDTCEIECRVLLGNKARMIGTGLRAKSADDRARAALDGLRAMTSAFEGWSDEEIENVVRRTGDGLTEALGKALGVEVGKEKADPEVSAATDFPT